MKYLVKFIETTNGDVLLEYNEHGNLIAFKMNVKLVVKQHEWFLKHLPIFQAMLMIYKPIKNISVEELKQDLTFTTFWNTYKNKVGNKTRSKKLFEALNEIERAKAINYIKRYDNWLNNNSGIMKLYPETYLNQKRFNNE